MFQKFAKYRLFQFPHMSGRREAVSTKAIPARIMPANDNLPGVIRPGARRRHGSRPLVCRWSLTDNGKRLSCRWQPETLAQTALEDPDPGPSSTGYFAAASGPVRPPTAELRDAA